MTPLQLSILIHYYGCANDYRDGDFSAPAVREAIDWFKDDAGLLQVASGTRNAGYELTEKGAFFVDRLCAMPLPVSKWVMP